MFETILAAIVPTVLPGAGALVMGLVSLALVSVKNYVTAKTNNVLAENALTRITHTAETVVASLNQTVVQGLKDASADGKLSKDEAVNVKNQAIDTIKAQLPEAIKQNAGLGINDLEQFITAKIEQAVGHTKPVQTKE